MDHITSVEQLTEILDIAAPSSHAKVMKRIKIGAEEIEQFSTWAKEGYTRNCLARTAQYEVILLCWDIGAKAPVHGHGGEDCWVYQIQGTVREKRFKEEGGNLIETNQLALTPGKLCYMNDRMGYHSIENNSNQRAMTLHIYASPIDACQVYNDKKDCFELKELSYNTFKGNEVEIPIS